MEQGFFATENEFRLAVDGGFMPVRVFKPTRYGPFPPIVLFMGMYGVSDSLCSIARLLAERGFAVFVPDFYWRSAADETFVPEDFDAALDAMHALSDQRCMDEVGHLFAEIRSRRDVVGSVAGFGVSLGGRLCIRSAIDYSDDMLCTCSYYAIGVEQLLTPIEGLSVPLQMVIAGQDMFVAPEKIESLEKSLLRAPVEHELLCYREADHNFLDFSQPGYDPLVAAGALQQTTAFIQRYSRAAVA